METSGTEPDHCRVISVAAVAVDAAGTIENAVVSLLDPGVDPVPTNIHGLTRQMLASQPRYADIAADLAAILRGRTLVAHNVAPTSRITDPKVFSEQATAATWSATSGDIGAGTSAAGTPSGTTPAVTKPVTNAPWENPPSTILVLGQFAAMDWTCAPASQIPSTTVLGKSGLVKSLLAG